MAIFQSLVESSLYVSRRVSDALAQNKLQCERGVPLIARAGDDVEPWDLKELLFQWRRDVVRHRHRIRAGILARNLNDW